jgi:hypothetical protein
MNGGMKRAWPALMSYPRIRLGPERLLLQVYRKCYYLFREDQIVAVPSQLYRGASLMEIQASLHFRFN